jgi:hypothetical protein
LIPAFHVAGLKLEVDQSREANDPVLWQPLKPTRSMAITRQTTVEENRMTNVSLLKYGPN